MNKMNDGFNIFVNKSIVKIVTTKILFILIKKNNKERLQKILLSH